MVGMNGNGIYSDMAIMFVKEYWMIFAAAVACMLPLKKYFLRWLGERKLNTGVKVMGSFVYIVGLCALLFFCVVVLAKGGYNPFIYFNF